jgi:anti-sigma regulatory factor (Ser/Thr protein kinase)
MSAALSLCNDLAELPRIVAFATQFAERAGLPAQDLWRLLVVLDELFSNIVRHGYEGLGPDRGHIDLLLFFSDGCLGIELTDDGRPFDPLAVESAELDCPAAQRPIGRLGIPIVRNLVDQARYVRQGERNRLFLSRRVRSAPAE